MKMSALCQSLTTLFLAGAVFLWLSTPSVRSATVVGGTGYSVDAIVEAAAASPTAGTDYDGWANWVMAEIGAPDLVNGTGLPADGQLNSKNGTPFQLQPYTGPNTLVDGDTFTLDTPCSYSDLRFLVTGIGGSAANNFSATVTFTDTSTALFQFSVIDWQLNSTYDAFDTATAYVRRTSTQSLGLWNRELIFTLSAADRAKTVESITFSLQDRLGLSAVSGTAVASTIDPTDRFAWGENIGWTDWRHDTGAPGKGAVIGQYFCSGFIWGENVGWLRLGTGSPADGIHYTNTDSADYGVNHDGKGALSGLAWGENIGWITFDQGATDPPRVDLATGKLAGYAYGENVGWIDLGSNGMHFVRTGTIDEGPDTDLDMIADSWELEQAANAGLGAVLTHLDKTTDSDGDGKSDFDEYLADTDPFDSADALRILTIGVDELLADITLEWTSSPRRLYDLGRSTDLNAFPVEVPDLAPDPGATTSILLDLTPPLDPRAYWRVGAKLPLAAP